MLQPRILLDDGGFPVVHGGYSAYGPGPLDFLVGEGDFFAQGVFREVGVFVVEHGVFDGTDVGVGEGDGVDEFLCAVGGYDGPEVQDATGEVLVVDEGAPEEWGALVVFFDDGEGLVLALAGGESGGGVARADDCVIVGVDEDAAFAAFLGD